MNDNTISREFSPSWSSYTKSLIFAIPTLGLTLIWAWWNRRNTSYIVDDGSVTKEYDGLSSKSERIESSAIKRIETSQGLFEKLRNRGTVKISDSSGETLTISGVTDHKGLVESLR